MEFIVLSLLEYYLFSFGLSATKRLVSHKFILKTGIKMNTLSFQQSCSQGSLLLVPRVLSYSFPGFLLYSFSGE